MPIDALQATPASPQVLKFVTHSKKAIEIARDQGWFPGARYTNLRDVRSFERLGFLDIEWRRYDFDRHLSAAKSTRPHVTVARDIMRRSELNRVIQEAHELALWCDQVIVVPKDPKLSEGLNDLIPPQFVLGYSVPSKYGSTYIETKYFTRPVHLLGGRPDKQRALADQMPVVSLDCNRFTLDAKFGDYFSGQGFERHPVGGYARCLTDSVRNINAIWNDYPAPLRLLTCASLNRAA